MIRSDFTRPIFTNRSYTMDWFLVPWLRRTTLDSLDSAEHGCTGLQPRARRQQAAGIDLHVAGVQA